MGRSINAFRGIDAFIHFEIDSFQLTRTGASTEKIREGPGGPRETSASAGALPSGYTNVHNRNNPVNMDRDVMTIRSMLASMP
jgi:hypothetical protein